MGRSILYLILVLLLGSLFACNRSRVPYINASKVEIEYYDSIKINEWIKFDDLVLTHTDSYESIRTDSLNGIETVIERNILPSSIQVARTESSTVKNTSIRADYAYALFLHLSNMKLDGKLVYGFEGNTLNLSSGKLTLYRRDGRNFKVSTSKGYGAAVRKIE